MSAAPSLVWFRRDLRITDNPALIAAAERGAPVIPVFVWAPDDEESWQPGAASRWWLHRSLALLDGALRRRGLRLIFRQGPAVAALRTLAQQTQAGAAFWGRLYEPAQRSCGEAASAALRTDGLRVETFNTALLYEPDSVRNAAGKPFQVFTPFWQACLHSAAPPHPRPAPAALPAPARWPETLALAQLDLEPTIDWAAGLRTAWTPGEAGAAEFLERFLAEAVLRYPDDRNRPSLRGGSRLSPHLHFGEISPRQVWHAVSAHAEFGNVPGMFTATEQYLRQIGWREFAHHLLFHFPYTPEASLRPAFERFPWLDNPSQLGAWQRGRTGYPIVDAGMRELWHTGWMHNRVRMIVASFLIKDLLIPWQRGARWFWDTLVDADLANNTLGWQWSAGCGADAAPYFRIFNPVTQGEQFDPQGSYISRWVPELARLPVQWIFKPWLAPPHVLADAAVELGHSYPAPIVDHGAARVRALAALATIKKPDARNG